jgi:hypothetical protein
MSHLSEESKLHVLDPKSREEQDRIEVHREARERAVYVRSYYLALMSEGFSESEALMLASEG